MNADIGVVGMAVMGQNLALNMERKGFVVAVYNRTRKRTEDLVAGRGKGRRFIPCYDLEAFVSSLARPRKVLLMVKAGQATDAVLKELFPLLEPGDVVMDGGNSHFLDTERRLAEAERRGLLYLGVGISGGEHGALHGPAIMPGGHREGYAIVEDILAKTAAQGPQGSCCAFLGPGSAGHYVKMVHNGIEYAIMQALAECYDLMKRGLSMAPREMADVFATWNGGELSGYLLEITERILRHVDPDTGRPLVELIRDTAQQKGTGKWSTQAALDEGTCAPTIAAAVFARTVSALKEERRAAAGVLPGPSPEIREERGGVLEELFGALYLTIVAAYAQGFRQLGDASRERGYDLSLAEVARVWMDGCIIRSRLLVPMRTAFMENPDLPLLFLALPFASRWREHHGALRATVMRAHRVGIPVPAMGSALDFLDAYRTERLPANLIQAHRDFFGAHTYERVDRPGVFHTDWESAP
ncbi:NADP-dependent phosphogluconate dehydrogenase [Candidatus Bipolaricaulota bacterium]|nr:NADP-dependent phosphogluconate dehydrogenase [Candidatus Bipolaricaulota bacterium]